MRAPSGHRQQRRRQRDGDPAGARRCHRRAGDKQRRQNLSVSNLLACRNDRLIVDAKAHAEQIRSVATERLRHRIGRISPVELAELDQALRLHLEL
jgi:mRNA-degrading endonuclease toxin of MazEF toxin-antitoxin module